MIKRIGMLTSGGDCQALNATMRGVVKGLTNNVDELEVYGFDDGYKGLIYGKYRMLTSKDFSGILTQGGTILGTSRQPFKLMRVPDENGLDKVEAMKQTYYKLCLDCLVILGGNGTQKTANLLREEGLNIIHLPKTIDNDIGITDHTPGYGSTARYIARTTAEIGADVKSLPIHVCILEAMGRNAGWITAASALARKKHGDAPHLIYLPERPFREEEFLADVKELYDRLGGVVVVASEGLKDESGKPVVPPIFQTGRSVYYGDVGAYLAELVIKKLGIKARSEKPGLCGRASISLQSPVDREEAVLAGREALKAAMEGCTGIMIGFARREQEKYEVCPIRIPVEQVMLTERTVPASYINNRGNDVTDAFVSWCRPLTGEEIPDYIDFQEIYRERREDRE
mgnify:CR=1 FL=1